MRICVIFNPAARGDKARHFRQWLDGIATECALKPTRCAGDARRLAAEAVAENFELIVAAGGDGTVNEVLNGIGAVPEGYHRACLGVLPLGTVNVFARELKMPAQLPAAWAILQRSRERRLDLGRVDYQAAGQAQSRYFMQMAGAGTDARAIELVSWKLKKKLGPLAYVIAGFQALAEKQPRLTIHAGDHQLTGELALFGNGQFYGGTWAVFPDADWADGLLDVCVFPRATMSAFLRLMLGFVSRQKWATAHVHRRRARQFTVTSDLPAAFELDGEWVGHLPATFSVEPNQLRVVGP